MNELKLVQVELFKFFHFMRVAAEASELYYMAHLTNIKRFLFDSNFFFKYQILNTSKLTNLS